MDTMTKHRKGSPFRDTCKLMHKLHTPQHCYASDLDLCLVEFKPPGIVAALDYKTRRDTVTPTERIVYNHLIKAGVPVFIVVSDDPECGPFEVKNYPNLAIVQSCKSWEELASWEQTIRNKYQIENHRNGSSTCSS